MAKTPVRTRKRVKKQVADGMAHIHASFNNTIVTLTDRQGNLYLGRLPVVQVSVVHVNLLRSLRK
jgi:ribosomal protein S11